MTVNNFSHCCCLQHFRHFQSPKLNELLRRLLIRESVSIESRWSVSRAFISCSLSYSAYSLRLSRRAFLLSSADFRLKLARVERSNFSGISIFWASSVALVGRSLRLNKPSRSPPRESSIFKSLNSFCFFWSRSISYCRRNSCLVRGILYLGLSGSGCGSGSVSLTGSTTSGSDSGIDSSSGACTAAD